MTSKHLPPGEERENLYYRIPPIVRGVPPIIFLIGCIGIFIAVPRDADLLFPDRVWGIIFLAGVASSVPLVLFMMWAKKRATGNYSGFTNAMRDTIAYRFSQRIDRFFKTFNRILVWLAVAPLLVLIALMLTASVFR